MHTNFLGGFDFPGVVKSMATSGPRMYIRTPQKTGWDAYVAHCESLCRSAWSEAN